MGLRITSALSALLVVGAAADAFALDGWRDRRGLLFGLGIGGGIGQVDVDGADSEVGVNVRARVGGGLNEHLTLDFDVGLHFQDGDSGPVKVSTQLATGMVGANYFVYDGLYLRGMGGMGHFSVDPEGKLEGDSETGLGLGFGAGYEFFANADLAIGGGADYRRLFFDKADFTLIGFGITATWY